MRVGTSYMELMVNFRYIISKPLHIERNIIIRLENMV